MYADDILLICPSRYGLQAMVNICQNFANENNLKFSTNDDPEKSKTKCLHFSKSKIEPAKIELDGRLLPWVKSAKHLGNILERDNTFSVDIDMKRGKFIGKIHSLMQEFNYATPDVTSKILQIYTTSFYGSNLWNILGKSCEKLYKAWNVAIRMVYKVPRETHRYFIEELTEVTHPKVMLAKRFVKFHETVQKSHKLSVKFLSEICKNDKSTVYGNQLWEIASECETNSNDLCSFMVNSKMCYTRCPDEEAWRIPLLKELLNERWEVPGFSNDELDDLIHNICVT